ncbi:PREDICTED: putative non-specific lipid-transfer protein 14 [Lupinus angustifolius]|uniref:putative non-specific lipid-transfer protein 14 n=1 Tax=Lupinus angustifolius TaxID=3871 RepID=UPI00092F3F7B|nr:PREDICTED: putative non-specific lipid-transfer protein 14 [Lupinus angustifolius]
MDVYSTITSSKTLRIIGMVILLYSTPFAYGVVECSTVFQLFAGCSTFITYGSPDPIPGTPCCDAMSTLRVIANSAGAANTNRNRNRNSNSNSNRQSVCGCLMSLINTYNPNATAIATLPGFCGISLGFTIDPNTDCTLIT